MVAYLPATPQLTDGEARGKAWEEWAQAVRDLFDLVLGGPGGGLDPVTELTDAQRAYLTATYVAFKNFDGTAVTGKHVEITLTSDGTDIDNIRVVTP